MIEKLKMWFKHLLTEPDNATPCFVRWTAFIGALQGFLMHGWSVFVQHAPFNLQEYGVGMGAILFAVGAALGLKKDTPKE